MILKVMGKNKQEQICRDRQTDRQRSTVEPQPLSLVALADKQHPNSTGEQERAASRVVTATPVTLQRIRPVPPWQWGDSARGKPEQMRPGPYLTPRVQMDPNIKGGTLLQSKIQHPTDASSVAWKGRSP